MGQVPLSNRSGRSSVSRQYVERRVTRRDRELLWLEVFAADDRIVRRLLVELPSGEVLDDVWLDAEGCVRSWSKGRADPPAAGDSALCASRSVVGSGWHPQDHSRAA